MTDDFKNCPIGAEMLVRVEAAEKLAARSLDALRSELAVLRGQAKSETAEIKHILGLHGRALFGNGSAGVRAELQEHRVRLTKLEACNQEAAQLAHAWRMQRWGWVVAVGIALMSLVAGFIQK